MIRIGNQTSFAAAPLEPFDYAVANGFDAFEWFPDKKPGAGWDETDLGEAQRRQIRERARERQMRLSVHARWQAEPFQPETFELFWRDLALAQDVAAVSLNIHLAHERGISAYLEAILPLIRRTAEAGIQLTIENTLDQWPELFNELFAALRRLRSARADHVALCFDLGHANLCSATRNRYLEFVDRLDPQLPIGHLHLHENWGDADTHLTLFTGPAGRDESGIRGLIKRLRKRNFSGSIILEQWPNPPSLLNQARDRLRQMLGSDPGGGTPAGREPNLPPATERAGTKPSADPHDHGSRLREPTPAPHGQPEESAFLQTLVAADQRSRSWREKLDVVRDLLVQRSPPRQPGASHPAPIEERLAYIAIYLRFLNSRQIPCQEDGRHFRPSHHARTALKIQQHLARITVPANAFLVRKIYPWLPSTAEPFQRAEPLTRIRDIAHRNDIPSELKGEIKRTLQNKLHRCAGPEDLATSQALLDRITAQGADYSAAFVDQFKIFHDELKEFFNARSLEERLHALLPTAAPSRAALIRSFLVRKESASSLQQQLDALTALTDLRRDFHDTSTKNLEAATDDALHTDIELENFAFALLSNLTNGLQAEVRVPLADAAPPPPWSPLLHALSLSAENLRLSHLEPEESGAIASESRAWNQEFERANREHLLRLKATADRARRLAEDHSQRILALFPPRAEKLGRALGVADQAILLFSEDELRRHIIFQFAKLTSLLLSWLRRDLALPPWDVLVGGVATGRVLVLHTLSASDQQSPEARVVLLDQATGDEEIPPGIAGIVLAHDMPHLSHLGVRARQAGVVFVTSEETAGFEQLKALAGRLVKLTATAEKVDCQALPAIAPAAPGDQKDAEHPKTPASRASAKVSLAGQRHAVQLSPEPTCLPLEQVTLETVGHKADGTRRLAELTVRSRADFKVPSGLAIPFGVLEAALRKDPRVESEYRRLSGGFDQLPQAEWATAAAGLRNLIQNLRVPREVLAEIAKRFGPEARLMVRSSSNCEDLPELAGAGLYESVPDVTPANAAAAIRTVWASLWTDRAAVSRRQTGILHEHAHMAVLVQAMVSPDLSFVLHTVNPINRNTAEVYAELALGLGETLVSGATRGNPYRLVCDKAPGEARTLAFANFSSGLRPKAGGGLSRERIDYSTVPFSRDAELRRKLGRRLGAVGRLIEAAFGTPQDIEGAVVGSDLWLVQARPQQGLLVTRP